MVCVLRKLNRYHRLKASPQASFARDKPLLPVKRVCLRLLPHVTTVGLKSCERTPMQVQKFIYSLHTPIQGLEFTYLSKTN